MGLTSIPQDTNKEATQLLVKTNTDNLQPGQDIMANSIPVVIASDQSTLPIALSTPEIATYSAAITGLVAPALATDIFTIIGSASKTVKVLSILISATRTSNGHVDIALIKRSTANTGGTSSTPTIIPHDSTNPAGTAVVRAYTANPTLGTTVGTMRSEKLFINTVGSSNATDKPLMQSNPLGQPLVVLNGVTQQLSVSLGGVTITGNNFDITITWTEE